MVATEFLVTACVKKFFNDLLPHQEESPMSLGVVEKSRRRVVQGSRMSGRGDVEKSESTDQKRVQQLIARSQAEGESTGQRKAAGSRRGVIEESPPQQ